MSKGRFMIFINSLKLFKSNWLKVLKFLLYYVVVWGLCFALFLPVFFAFKDLIVGNFESAEIGMFGVFSGSVGGNIQKIVAVVFSTFVEAFHVNVGLAIYGLIVGFILLPFLINVGKYALCNSLYYYMTSNNQMGFLSALVKGLRKSIPFAIVKTMYNLLFITVLGFTIFGLTRIVDEAYVKYALWLVIMFALVLFYSLEQVTILGWIPAIIVFDCNVFRAYLKGIKAAARHFGNMLGIATLFFLIFWAITMVFGFYSLAIIIPVMACVLCVYDMVAFFTSQGMRFYITPNKILTPKKLEEVDDINKTAYIL